MNSDSFSNSMRNSTEVVSKYFKTSHTMDDSASDFQEPKKCIGTAKNKQKPNISKVKRNATKKIKGQKDIRTALSKNNDLLNYSKDFGEVCKQTGIDVDPEQLQLAIAMSESLQTDSNKMKGYFSGNPLPLTAQGRAERIKSNLLKFGFKIPDVNINLGKNKKNKKVRKSSKLLSISEAERKQIVIDKYTQVVLTNIQTYKVNSNCDVRNSRLYYLATQCSYAEMKQSDPFYTTLIEISPNSMGSLLRDWSKIPGRPPSPVREKLDLDITKLNFSQEEFDIVMSKRIALAQKLIKVKLKEVENEEIKVCIHDEDLDCSNKEVEIVNDGNLKQNVIKDARSPSPDLFEDESVECIKIITSSNESMEDLSSQTTTDLKNKKSNDTADLHDCVSKEFNLSAKQTTTENQINSIILIDNKNENYQKTIEKIDLTQSFCETYPKPETITPVNKFNDLKNDSVHNVGDVMDLTQSSSSSNNDVLPFVHISGQSKQESTNSLQLTNSKDDFIEVPDTNSKSYEKLEEYVFEHSHESDSIDNAKKSCSNEVIDNIDLTQTSKSSNEQINYNHDYLGKQDGVSIDYDDMYASGTSSHVNLSDNKLNLDKSDKDFDELMKSNSLKENSILTPISNDNVFEISDEELNYSIRRSICFETRNKSEENYLIDKDDNEEIYTEEQNHKIYTNKTNDSLPLIEIKGRKVKLKNSSISADNATSNVVYTPKNSKYIIKTNNVTPMQDYESMTTPEMNKELDKYGLKPFKRKRAIQLLTHLYNQTHPIIDNSEDLPSPSKRQKTAQTKEISPIKSPHLSHNAYLSLQKSPILSQNVYSKSQISPSKTRKSARALMSPAKNSPMKPKKHKSPTKSQKSPTKSQKLNIVEDDILVNYEVTSECPLIKDIDCDEEDWVFQKREKAKLHSCRVPLHVAFHNYVTCRQGLREAILRYEPINIDVLHRDLASDGHRYDPKELLKYLDKRCITVKTASNDARNKQKKS